MPAQRVGQASRRPGTREAADDPLCPQVPHLEIQSLAEEGDPLAWPSLRLAVHALGARNSVGVVY